MSSSSSLQQFVAAHSSQLDMLQIPEPLFESLRAQLEAAYIVQYNPNQDRASLDIENLALFLQQSQHSLLVNLSSSTSADYGAMMVIPHAVSWDILRGQGLIEALQELESGTLQLLWQGLQTLQLQHQQHDETYNNSTNAVDDLVNAVAGHPAIWSRVILYRSAATGAVRAALPVPPYLPQSPSAKGDDVVEADCTGPFPFQYHHPVLGATIDVALVYVSPEGVASMQAANTTNISNGSSNYYLPTIDLVPAYQCPDAQSRAVRYAALLYGTDELPAAAAAAVKQVYAEFVHDMHLLRQAALERQEQQSCAATVANEENDTITTTTVDICSSDKVYRVYTDADDPMHLKHPIAGLEANSPHFVMVDILHEADIVYSFSSVFSPNSPIRDYMVQRQNDKKELLLVNQFPFEGAFVQKDHLARELLKQHGLPRPPWSLESYDLDVQLAEFVGAVVSDAESHADAISCEQQPPSSLWIVKPAAGTQSKGHVVTRSLAHILRLVDGAGGGRVAQRYIEKPICLDGRKVDCRCLVLMAPSTEGYENRHQRLPLPKLYMHNTVYFRIANKRHAVSTARDLTDHESVLTASHLLDSDNRTSADELQKLPVARDTIAKLEADYPGSFEWEGSLLPGIQTMIRELFNGMTTAFPAMGESKQSRALYGVDVMFQIDEGEGSTLPVVTPKLTEVTFCPSNNALCDAYVRDDDAVRSYNKDIFECLFLGKVSKNITRLQ